ncbi:MAG: hypothetical protein HY040_26970 [Planctomycetes bacterium]|nr:hypothetical protein [Planctomycetota bacterium]
MALQSQLFRGDFKLEAAAVSDPAHIVPGSQGPHVAKIQRALNLLEAGVAENGIYGRETAAAVSAFKQSRNILNFQGKIDNIVGKKTMAALDSEMLAIEQGRKGGGLLLNFDALAPVIDFVVRFRAGSDRDAKQNLDPAKLSVHAAKPNRSLSLISVRNADLFTPDVVNKVVLQIDKELKDAGAEQGIICINGNSLGARKALEFAAALKGKRTIKFVGLADAALFPNLPGMNKPKVPNGKSGRGEALNFPHWGSPPSIDAEVKQNFFQNADNNFTQVNRSLAPTWTGNVFKGDQEIHGLISGFPGPPDPGDPQKSGGVEIAVPITRRAIGAHEFAGDEGDTRNGATISDLLAAV